MIRKLFLLLPILWLVLSVDGIGQQTASPDSLWSWEDLPPLPPAPGQSTQLGLAGPFAGTHQGALIVAGGANFPEDPPWEGGPKVWWDDVYILPEQGGQWITGQQYKLPRPLAYGVSISTEKGIVCIGGCDQDSVYRDVFMISWDSTTQKLNVEELPVLPSPMAFMAGAQIGNTLYVAGGQESMRIPTSTRHFFALDLSQKTPAWETLPEWPGPDRVVAMAAAQSDGVETKFYLFGGRSVSEENELTPLADGYAYSPSQKSWEPIADLTRDGQTPYPLMASVAIASGINHILVFGGAHSLSYDPASHPGFIKDLFAYHTITDTWTRMGTLPFTSPVTTTAVPWGKSIVIPSGEKSPGIRTPAIRKVSFQKQDSPFSWPDYLVIGLYLLGLVGMGIYFSRREHSTEDYFKAGGRVPWWAAGLSIFGTSLSAITFMAVPAKTFATDWSYLILSLSQALVAPIVVWLILPFYRRLSVTSAYEYLEKRFNLAARLIGGLAFVLFQFGRIGIVLFLPAITLSLITGIDIYLCIVLMAVLSIIYTVMGGIEAVVWTDVLQVVVLMGGAIFCLFMISGSIEGGMGAIIDQALADQKLRTFDFSFDFSTPSFWVVLGGGFAASLITQSSDQSIVQRYLTTKDEKSAARGVWTFAAINIPTAFIFFGLGTLLYVFFKTYPTQLPPTMSNPDGVLPWYIITQLPAGLSGLLIAGIFAAAMSSLDSSMNSVAAVFTTDFFQRFSPGKTDRDYLTFAKWITVLIGLAGMTFALLMAGYEIKSLWDEFSKVLGLFTGGLAGLFLLGMVSTRAHARGALIGFIISGLIQFWVSQSQSVHFLLYTLTGLVSCMLLGYVASLVMPAPKKSLDGLTIFTLGKTKK